MNCEVELCLKCSRNYVLIEHDNHIIGVGFIITSAKFDVPVVTLSINNNIKSLENMKQGFKRKISWNRYRSEITTKPKTIIWIIWLIQHLEVLIDCLIFLSNMIAMVLQDILLINISCH